MYLQLHHNKYIFWIHCLKGTGDMASYIDDDNEFQSLRGTTPQTSLVTSPEMLQWDVANTGFAIQELDSVQILQDIIFYLESDSIVVSFSSSSDFLWVDIRQFWFQHITYYFLSSCSHAVLLFLSTTYDRKKPGKPI